MRSLLKFIFLVVFAFSSIGGGLATRLAAEPTIFLIPLEGEWRMMRGDDRAFARPDFDDSLWPTVILPRKMLLPGDTAELFENTPAAEFADEVKGYAWFRKTFDLAEVPDPDTRVSIQIGEIQNADRVFLNGKLIGEGGRFPPEFRSGWSRFRSYPVPPDYLKAGENSIAIQMYFDSEAWINGPINLVDAGTAGWNSMVNDFFLNHGLEAMSFLLIAIGIFFLFFYVQRNQEIEYFYFALSSFAVAVTISLQYFENKYPEIPLSSNTILKITQSALLYFPSLLSLFYKYYSDGAVTRRRLLISLLLPLSGVALMASASERSDILLYRNLYLVMIPIFIIDLLVQSVRQIAQGNKKGMLIIIGLLPCVLLGVHDVLAFAVRAIDSSIALFIYGIPIFLLIIAGQLSRRFVQSLTESEQLNVTLRDMMDSFARFVPLQFIRHLNKEQITDVALGDAMLNNMTILFTDIRDFSRLSEGMSPEENFKFLNSFMRRMEPSIKINNGFVDKFIGDAIMALFSETAEQAVRAAIQMRHELLAMNAHRADQGYQHIDFGIGVNSGEVMLGTVGSSNRMDTTVIGNTVNLASRLEGLTKVYKMPIIISHYVYGKLTDPSEFHIREIDLVRVKGIEEPVYIYEVFDNDPQEIREAKWAAREIFAKALAAYREGDFAAAKALFEECSRECPQDTCAQFFIRRCDQLILSPPGARWRGVSKLN
jgi:adenylate cyclase